MLTITLKNVSQEPLKYVRGSPYCDLAFNIQDVSGRTPKLTALGERLPKSEAERGECPVVSASLIELQPGDERSIQFDLTKVFELVPGTEYTVRVRWVKGLPAVTPSGRLLRRELSRTLVFR